MGKIKIPNSIVPIVNSEISKYNETINRWKKFSIESRMVLFSRYFIQIKKEDSVLYFLTLRNIIKGLSLFPDKLGLKKLRQLGVNESTIRWFVSFRDLDGYLSVIERKKIVVLRNVALETIGAYIRAKIQADLLENISYLDIKVVEPRIDMKKELVLLYRRRHYVGLKPMKIRTPFHYLLNEIANDYLKEYKNIKKAKAIHLATVDGRVDTLFTNNLLRCFIPFKKYSQTEFLNYLKPVFQAVFKSKAILDGGSLIDTDFYMDSTNNLKRYNSLRIKSIAAYNPEKDNFGKILIQ